MAQILTFLEALENSEAGTVSSLAGRLSRLNKQLEPADHARIAEISGGVALTTIVSQLFGAIDADAIEKKALELAQQPEGSNPGDLNREKAQAQLVKAAANVFTGPLVELLDTNRFKGTSRSVAPLGMAHRAP